ncbi:MAG: hypothetical protein PHO26_06550 [Dehalococcoidia bacterium]|nr:hypothetical protein [Dehalococcoidia bacterium]MDD5493410.1 hypothetical protein [Dehalococcoidia bacterium]
METNPEASSHAHRHDYEEYDRKLDKEFKPGSVNILKFFQHSDNTQLNIPKAAMNAATIPEAIIADTSPTMYSLPSMINLLLFISAATGLTPARRWPGAVVINNLYGLSPVSFPANLPVFDLVNISDKYPGNEPPSPEGIAAPAFYRQLERGIASTEICPTLLRAWRLSAFPAALFCKVRTAISHLLY